MNEFNRKKYKADRLTEALCQINFDTPSSWNGTTYGVFLQSARDLGFSETEEVNIQASVPIVGAAMMRYKKPETSELIQLSPNLFSVNHLAPYPGWEVFKPQALVCCRRFEEVISPEIIRRVGLRYINRFSFDTDQVILSDWFAYYPTLPQIEGEAGPFVMRCQWNLEQGHTLTASLGVAELKENEKSAIILEFDYGIQVPENWDFARLSDDIEIAHARVSKAFNASVTVEMQHLLDEVESK